MNKNNIPRSSFTSFEKSKIDFSSLFYINLKKEKENSFNQDQIFIEIPPTFNIIKTNINKKNKDKEEPLNNIFENENRNSNLNIERGIWIIQL